MAILLLSSPSVINGDFRSYSITFILQFRNVFTNKPSDLTISRDGCWPVYGTKLYDMLMWTSQPRLLLQNSFRQPKSLYNLEPMETDLNTKIVQHHRFRRGIFMIVESGRDQAYCINHNNRQLTLEHSSDITNLPASVRARKWSLRAPISNRMFPNEYNQNQTLSAAEMAITSILKMLEKLGKASRPAHARSNIFHTCRRASIGTVTAEMASAEGSIV